jgi:hypothetical protein
MVLLVGAPAEDEEHVRQFLPQSQFFTASLKERVALSVECVCIISSDGPHL